MSSALGIDYHQVYRVLIVEAEIRKQNKEVRECQRQARNQVGARTSAITAVQR